MSLVKYLAIAALVGGVGYVAYQKLPGLRTKVDSTVDEYGGWTEEARHKDPVGFLEHAEQKLEQDRLHFQDGLKSLGTTRNTTLVSITEKQATVQGGGEVLELLKSAYQSAQAADAWPAQVLGQSYTRDKLVQQANEARAEVQGAQATIENLTAALGDLDALETDLRQRIRDTEAALLELLTQKQIVKVRQLTAETDALLAQVSALLGTNSAASTELDGPVRDIKSLLSARSTPQPGSGSQQDTLDFLEN